MHVSIREFTGPSFPVYMYDADGNYSVKTTSDVRSIRWLLLPLTNLSTTHSYFPTLSGRMIWPSDELLLCFALTQGRHDVTIGRRIDRGEIEVFVFVILFISRRSRWKKHRVFLAPW